MKYCFYGVLMVVWVLQGCSKTPDDNRVYKEGYKYLNYNSRVVGDDLYYLKGVSFYKMSVDAPTPKLITTLPQNTIISDTNFSDLVFDCDDQAIYYCWYNQTTMITKIMKKNFSNPEVSTEIATVNRYVLNLQLNSKYVFGLETSTGKIFSISRLTNAKSDVITDANSLNITNSFEADEDNIYYVNASKSLIQFNLTTMQSLKICPVKDFDLYGNTMKICNKSLLIPYKEGLMSVTIPITQENQVLVPVISGYFIVPFTASAFISYPSYCVLGSRVYELIYTKYNTDLNTSATQVYAVISKIYAINPSDGEIQLIKDLYGNGELVTGIYGVVENNGKYTIFTDKGTITSD